MKIRNFLFSFTGQSLLLYNGLFLPGEIVQNLAITYCSLRFMVFFLLLICIIFLVNNLSQSDENKATIEEITQLSLNRVPLSNFLKSMSYVVAFVYYSKGLFSLAITITITCLIELLINYIVNRLSKLWVDDVLQNEGL